MNYTIIQFCNNIIDWLRARFNKLITYNKMKDKLKKSLIGFLEEAESISNTTNTKNLPQKIIKVYSRGEKRWLTNYLNVIDWWQLRQDSNIKSRILSSSEIESCLDILDILLTPRKGYRKSKKGEYKELTGKELITGNRNFNKEELYYLFLEFKELRGVLNIEEFAENITQMLFSETLLIEFRARLIGLNSNELNEFMLEEYEIGMLDVSEMLQMMNNYRVHANTDDTITIAVGYDDIIGYDFWLKGRYRVKTEKKKRGLLTRIPKNAIQEIENRIEFVLKTFRLHKSIEVGIRDYYIRDSSEEKSAKINKWTKQKYKFGDFEKWEKTSPSSYSRGFFQNFNYQLVHEDLAGLNNTFLELRKYYENPIEQISQALFFFSNSFEQNRSHYTFSDLITSLESLLNNPDSKNEVNKEKTLEKLRDIIPKIEATSDPKMISKLLFSVQSYKGMTSALSIGKKLISKDKSLQKDFYNFFYSDNTNDGCYRLRNDLFHGNYGNDIDIRITRTLPSLSTNVRDLLVKIIKLRINGMLDCDEEGYFSKLKEIANS